MTRYRVVSPDGHVYRVDVRDAAVAYSTLDLVPIRTVPWVEAIVRLTEAGYRYERVEDGVEWEGT